MKIIAIATAATMYYITMPALSWSIVNVASQIPINEKAVKGDQTHATVAMTDQNLSLVVFDSEETSKRVIWGRLIADNSLSYEFPISNNSFSNHMPDVESDNAARFIVTWAAESEYGGEVLARLLDASTMTFLTDEFKVNDASSQSSPFPDAAMNKNGDFIIIWSELVDEKQYHYVKIFNREAIPLTDPIKLSAYASLGKQQGLPDIAINDNGDAIASWIHCPKDAAPLVVYTTFNIYDLELGVAPTPEKPAELPALGFFQQRPTVDINNLGDIVFSWVEKPIEKGDNSKIFLKKYTKASHSWSNPIQPHEVSVSDQYRRSVAKIFSSGSFVASWAREQIDSGNENVYVRFFNPSGKILSREMLVNKGQQNNNQSRPALDFVESEGKIVMDLTWESNESKDRDIFANRYLIADD